MSESNPTAECLCDCVDDDPCCEATKQSGAGNGLMCTLRQGHEGDHIACGGEDLHRLAVWPQE